MTAIQTVRRVGLIGDVHCHDDVLRRSVNAIRELGVHDVFCVGDIVDGPGDADSTIATLKELNVECCAGNHERWFLEGFLRDRKFATQTLNGESELFLRSLPRTRMFNTPVGGAMLCHAVGEDDESFLRPSTVGYALQDIAELRRLMLDLDVQFLLCGHTHERMVRAFTGLTVVNAGTIHADFDASYCLIDFDALTVTHYCALADRFGEKIDIVSLPLPPPLPDLAAQ
ncbi:MAG: metallophosphoesterase family protein [Polyangiales bacterium]